MSLTGDIKTISLPGVLQLLSNENKTGLLRVKIDRHEYQIIFLEGAIAYAIESKKEARLGQLLINTGIITNEDLKRCVDEAKQKKQALGKVLVDTGFLSKETLYDFIYEQVKEILFDLFLCEKGQFEYSDMQFNPRWMVVIRLNNMNLMMDALRRVDEFKKHSGTNPTGK